MKAHQDIFTAKLHELEQQYECLRKRLEICNAQSHRQIHRELESARQEYNSLELRLKQIVKNSRSPAVSSLAKVQLEYSQKTERNFFPSHLSGGTNRDGGHPTWRPIIYR